MASKKIAEIPTTCPDCGGGVWDNTKGRGKRSPKAPDAACKDKQGCGWAGWLPDDVKVAKANTARPQEYAWGPLLKFCLQYTKKEIAPLLSNTVDEDVVYKYAYTIFAAAKDGGHAFKLPEAPPAPAVAVEAPTPPRPAPPPRRAEYDDSRDPLPF